MAPRHSLIQTLGALTLALFSLGVTAAPAPAPAPANRNHTVGGAAGWYFNTTSNATSANYTAWAASQTFHLGDFLIFNTNTNSTVFQTNNVTTYQLCDDSNDDGNQTFLWGGDNGDSNFVTPEVLLIPLIYEGPNYFFSDTMDGEQCQSGLKFGINVLHGNGQPSALNQPPPPPYKQATPPTASGGGEGENETSKKNGVEGMRGGVMWLCAGLGILSLVLLEFENVFSWF